MTTRTIQLRRTVHHAHVTQGHCYACGTPIGPWVAYNQYVGYRNAAHGLRCTAPICQPATA